MLAVTYTTEDSGEIKSKKFVDGTIDGIEARILVVNGKLPRDIYQEEEKSGAISRRFMFKESVLHEKGMKVIYKFHQKGLKITESRTIDGKRNVNKEYSSGIYRLVKPAKQGFWDI